MGSYRFQSTNSPKKYRVVHTRLLPSENDEARMTRLRRASASQANDKGMPKPELPRPLLLNSPQEKGCSDKRNQRSCQQHDKIDNVKSDAGVIHIHEPKSSAKMSQWK